MLLCSFSAASAAAQDASEAGIPQVQGVAVDGKIQDWATNGLGQTVWPENVFAPGSLADLPPAFRLAWDSRGLLVVVDADDAAIVVNAEKPWQGDSIEITATPAGTKDTVKAIATPNPDATKADPVMELHDMSGKGRKVEAQGRCLRRTGGYVLELLIQWSSFGMAPEAGRKLELDVRLNRSNGPGDWKQHRWQRLGKEALPLVAGGAPMPLVRAAVRYGEGDRLLLRVLGRPELAGTPIRVLQEGKQTASGRTEAREGWAIYEAALPEFGQGREADAIIVSVGPEDSAGTVKVNRGEFLAAAPGRGEEWPCHRHDAAQAGVTREKLIFPLGSAWKYEPSQGPAPAWPEPGKEWHRLDFDYAFQPVISEGQIFFGSSADDTLRALDLGTGKLNWRFTAGGPIRLAPAASGGRVYFAADDGCAYCLDAKTGAVVWRFRGAPGERKLLGNGRMISRWPCRSGVLVLDGVVYFTAGMWPAEGIYVYALDAQTGRQIWCNDSSGVAYRLQPHGGASAFTGVAPQGHMAATQELLIVPSGRTTPAAYDRRTGELAWYQPYLYLLGHPRESWDDRSSGGSWLLLAGDVYFSGVHKPGAPDIPSAMGEGGPQPGDGLATFSLKTGRRQQVLADAELALASGETLYAVVRGRLMALDFEQFRRSGAVAAKWSVEHGRAYSMALAADALLVGGADAISAYDVADGRLLGSVKTGEQVRGIAISARRVVAATDKGSLVCLGVGRPAQAPPTIREPRTWTFSQPGPHASQAEAILQRSGVTAGYALLVGFPDEKLAVALALQSDLHVINAHCGQVDPDRARAALLETHLYGSRLAVEALSDPANVPYASYFADLVVVGPEARGVAPQELYRLLRPCGGKMLFAGLAGGDVQRLLEACGAPKKEIRQSENETLLVRGALPGTGEWRCHWGDPGNTGIGAESRLSLPLELLWFGGPGPDRMMPRHWATSAPLCVNGRLFVSATNHVIAVDAYNGRELWARALTGAGRKTAFWFSSNFVADDDGVYVAVQDACHRLSQATGRTLAVYALPTTQEAGKASGDAVWSYLALTPELVLGGSAPRKNAEQSVAVWAVSKADGSPRWVYKARHGSVPNLCLAHNGSALFLLDLAIQPGPGQGGGRPRSGELVSLDLATGAERWRKQIAAHALPLRCTADVVLVAAYGAFDARTGQELWARKDWTEEPLIYDDKLLAGTSWDVVSTARLLRTGEPWLVPDQVTGRPRPWQFFRAYGCGEVLGCRGLLICRSGTLGLYDIAGEALTNFGAVRPNCSLSAIPAAGLLLMPEASSACSCSYNFQTSVALIPGGSDRDVWYVFGGEPDREVTRRLRLNLGAPGDRRDEQGNGWLGYPRPLHRFAKPVRLNLDSGSVRSYHRRSISAKLPPQDRPWLYSSGLMGATKLSLELVPRTEVLVPRCPQAPAMDGKLDDAAWKDLAPASFWENHHLSEPRATLLLCQDEKAIYAAFRREAARKDGRPVRFVANARDEKGATKLADDAVELFFSDAKGQAGLRLGVSAGAARFDGSRKENSEKVDYGWNGEWTGSAVLDGDEFLAEIAVPRATLRAAGLDDASLALNALTRNVSGVGLRDIVLTYCGQSGWPVCTGFLKLVDRAADAPPRPYTVRLHFAEPDDLPPGARVFQVRLQDQQALAKLDVVKEAGGPLRPLVKEFKGILAGPRLNVQLLPAGGEADNAPVLCGLEVLAEE